jgi:ketosteroid isomerase-like protein
MSLIDPGNNSGLLSVTPMGMSAVSRAAERSRHLAFGVVVVVLFATATRLSAMPRAEKHETRHQIEHLEDTWRSAVLRGNLTAMDSLLADDYMSISPNGILQSKEQTLAGIRAGTVHFTSLDLSDRKIRVYGTTALVTSRAEVTGTSPEGALSGSYRYTRVYVRDPRGVWRIVSFEASRIKQPVVTRAAKND